MKLLYAGILVLILLTAGCTQTSLTGQAVKQSNINSSLNTTNNKETILVTTSTYIPTTTTVSTTSTTLRKNCRELNGYICNEEEGCAFPWLDSSESYCCPIECGKCPADTNCDDGNSCTKDECNKDTAFQCKNTQMKPCINNAICEQGELLPVIWNAPQNCEDVCGSWFAKDTNCNGIGGGGSGTSELNLDCPTTCEDGDEYTFDFYNYESQKCEHINCPRTCEDIGYYSENNIPPNSNCTVIPMKHKCYTCT